jgi:LPS-assembly lipoprotein
MSWSEHRPRGRRRALRAAALGLAAAAAALAGCGYTLRQPPALRLKSLALAGFAPRSTMAQALGRQLRAPVQLLDDPARAEVVLRALEDRRESVVVATTAAAQVRELQLRVRLVFRAETAGGRELIPRTELLLARDMSYTEAFALAKEREAAELYRDMEDDIAMQVLRRLAAVSL